MVTDVDTPVPVPAPPKPAAPASPAKKKKKRKNASSTSPPSSATPDPLSESTPLPNESSITGDTLAAWRARATNRRALLAQAAADHALLTADLSAALARASDAEHAEATVNKGLVTARSVIAQRDRALADINTSTATLKAEHATLVEEKRRADKRLVILKTVSANLQEAREARYLAERKLEEAVRERDALRNEIVALKGQVEALNMLKQQLARVEMELDELTRVKEQLHVDAKRDSVRAAGLGAATVMALSFTLRLLSGSGKK